MSFVAAEKDKIPWMMKAAKQVEEDESSSESSNKTIIIVLVIVVVVVAIAVTGTLIRRRSCASGSLTRKLPAIVRC